ncbi:hypothetical protein KHA89_07005 [Bacillus sp. FJAT-49731]|uniref:Uncharacterized protein n=2 Tax=Lederbergia citrea TaxID=2833581 RepID=A0A942UKN7_9BACI|nr:hypothetical protein [Lederbergia citrea]MBS4203934.1 hypothetical protein [Lederbergia citrea]MBS4221482.1 hypothetical protein [Lederbergia citrea]
MKKYVALLLQLIIWSGFTMAQWLSGKDHFFSKIILFVVFFYLAFLLARMIVKSNKLTLWITIMSLSTYGMLHLLLSYVMTDSIIL